MQTLFPLMVSAMFSAAAPLTNTDQSLVFISSFAPGEGGAIHAFQLDPRTGRLRPIHRTAGVENPFFLALSPNRKFLYAIHARSFGGKEHEQVAAYALVGRSGELRLLNRQSSLGSASCYLEVDATGRTLLVANYATGSVASLPVREDGSLGEASSFHQHAGSSIHSERQEGPHAHCILVCPDNRYAFAADLGLDQLVSYRLDAGAAKLAPSRQRFVRTPPGAGPRHLAFHPSGKYLYAINELSNSVTLFDYDAESGMLFERQTIPTLPREFKGTSYCADVKITPNGRFLYGTNRGHDSIAAFRIGDDGRLVLLGIEPSLGKGPQNLAIIPGGEWLLCANMPGNNVAVFRIDAQTGSLASAAPPVSLPSPACIMVVP